MNTPFFSIVIPTRNRCETLYYTIKTILQQSFVDYEIIVSDNNSSDKTNEVVKKFQEESDKIQYVNTQKDLSMTENWEFGISCANGRYINVIADNDGYINGSLQYLYDTLENAGFPNIVRWDKNAYYWPDLNEVYVKRLVLKTQSFVQTLNINTIAEGVLKGTTSFQLLPMIYTSAVSSALLQQLKMRTGSFLKSLGPDIYSGFAIGFLVKNYLSISTPITIHGTSKKSTGYGAQDKNSAVVKEFVMLSKSSPHSIHPLVPYVTKSTYIAFFDSFLVASESLDYKEVSLNIKSVVDTIIKTARMDDEEELNMVKNIIIDTYSNNDELLSYAKDAVEKLSITKPAPSKNKLGFYDGVLYLDGEVFNINNIYEASKFMGNFYNYKQIF